MTEKKIIIRKAQPDEIGWISERYDEIGFLHSAYYDDLIAIAELNGQKAGIGRLQTLDKNDAELGGMYVFDQFRKKGIAKKIVTFLLEKSKNFSHVYCLPFEHLSSFYMSFGFVNMIDETSIPASLSKKHCWCNQQYSHKTLLFVRENSEFKK